MAQTFTDAYRSLIWDLLPAGSFWEGAGVERFVDGLTRASAPVAEFVATLYLEVWPFDCRRPMLEVWHEYLFPDSCLPAPVADDDLRARVLGGIVASDIGMPAGLSARIRALLPLVEVDDLPGPSIVPLSIPAPIDGASQVVEIWYAPAIDEPGVVYCVGRTYSPAAAIVRLVTPMAEYRQPAGGPLAADTALHWHEMRATSEIYLQRFTTLGPLLETTTYPISSDTGAKTLDELFPGLVAGDNVSAQRIEATFRRTWNGQGPTIVLKTLIYFP